MRGAQQTNSLSNNRRDNTCKKLSVIFVVPWHFGTHDSEKDVSYVFYELSDKTQLKVLKTQSNEMECFVYIVFIFV